jgi:hypothetical protein
MLCPSVHGRNVPIRDLCTAANSILFKRRVGDGERARRNDQAERLRGLEIEDQLVTAG